MIDLCLGQPLFLSMGLFASSDLMSKIMALLLIVLFILVIAKLLK